MLGEQGQEMESWIIIKFKNDTNDDDAKLRVMSSATFQNKKL